MNLKLNFKKNKPTIIKLLGKIKSNVDGQIKSIENGIYQWYKSNVGAPQSNEEDAIQSQNFRIP